MKHVAAFNAGGEPTPGIEDAISCEFKGGEMKVLSKERSKVLAHQMGWSLERAEGYVEGERYRRRGLEPSSYFRVGIDDFCKGFRAGYYERAETPIRVDEAPRVPLAR
jgi:hypothetical protein